MRRINFTALIGTNPFDAWMNDPLARTTELALVELTALARVDAVYVPPDIVSVAVLELVTPAAVEAVMLPVIVTEPVIKFETPVAAAAVTLPTMIKVPAPLLNAPELAAAKTFPLIVNVPVPVEVFPAPGPVLPVEFPVSVTDPDED